jgi:hypothetical protein
MRPDIFLATIGRGSNGSNALEVTEDRAGATSEQQDNVINTVNSLDPYGPSWQLVPGNVAAGTVYAQVPTSGTGDLTFSRASTATRTNSAGTIVDVATGVPRIHYRNADGSLSSTGRLLLEPQRTNSIRNSTMVGAVAGTPGTLPTNWANVNAGLTRTVVGVGTENGLPYVDVRFNGTASATNLSLRFEGNTQVAASNGQTWTNATYIKRVAGDVLTGVLGFSLRDSGGGSIANVTSNITLSQTLQRFSVTQTISAPTTAFIIPLFDFNVNIGQTYDFTIRIAAPQMELGANASTYIPTATTAVTRVPEAAFKSSVSNLIGQTEGTFYIDLQFSNLSSRAIFSVDTGSTTNFIASTATATGLVRLIVASAGVSTTLITTSAVSVGSHKIAFAYKAGQFAIYIDGVQAGTSTATNFPVGTLSQIILANASYGTLNDSVKQAALFTRRLTNAELAAITTL